MNANLENTASLRTNARRWMVGAAAVGLIGLGIVIGNTVDSLPSAVSTAQAATVETVAAPSFRELTVRVASVDDPAAAQDPLAVSY